MEINELIKLKELRAVYSSHKSNKVVEWDKVVLSGSDEWGTFLFTSMFDGGFEAVMVTSVGLTIGEPLENTNVEVVFHAQALWDGVRHMYFNCNDSDKESHGYLFYPYIPEMIKALQIVQDIQEKYCEGYEK